MNYEQFMDVRKILDVKTQLEINLQTLWNFRVENSDEAFRMHLKDQWGMAGQLHVNCIPTIHF